MGEFIETYAGVPTVLGLTATDGKTDLYPQASLFKEGAATPWGVVDMLHRSIGFYSATVTLSDAGLYRAVYRNFTDAGHTVPDTTRDNDQDTVLVRPLDDPKIGVSYDQALDTLLVEVTISRNGQPMPSAELTSAIVRAYDSDDHQLFSVSDLAPDSYGVFRLIKAAPGLLPDHLYFVRVSVYTSTAGTIFANKGFHTME